MADSVVLSVSQRQSVLELLRIADQRDRATRRLSTGLKVNQATDNPQAYARATALRDQASGLLDASARIGTALDTLAATQTGLDAVEKLGQQLKGIALAAQSADPATRAELAQQFDTTRQQLGLLAGDASVLGVNLLSNPADTLSVDFGGAPGADLTAAGTPTDAASLGVGDAASYNGFASAADVQNALGNLDTAIGSVRNTAAGFATDAAILNVRDEFSRNVANVAQQGADKLTQADLNSEAAGLLATQTRDALARQSLRITGQSQILLAQLVVGQ